MQSVSVLKLGISLPDSDELFIIQVADETVEHCLQQVKNMAAGYDDKQLSKLLQLEQESPGTVSKNCNSTFYNNTFQQMERCNHFVYKVSSHYKNVVFEDSLLLIYNLTKILATPDAVKTLTFTVCGGRFFPCTPVSID